MISIITAVHNQLAHNRLFLESIKRNTYHPHEIIIVDNFSTDGSDILFESSGCKVIRNGRNLCYPESMNIGMKEARYDYLCFLNNDVYVGVNWDRYLIEGMDMYKLDAASPIGIEKMPSPPLTKKYSKRWKRLGRSRHPKMGEEGLLCLLHRMYGDWDGFCKDIYNYYYGRKIDGIVGCCVMMRKDSIDKVGIWDEQVQAGDWDLYLRVRKRELEIGDVRRVTTICWSYVHHFIRATLKNNPMPFACVHPKISIEEKWGIEEVRRLWSDSEEVKPRLKERLKRYFINILQN